MKNIVVENVGLFIDTQKGKTPQAPSTPPSSKHDEDRKGKNLPRVEITREEEEEENNGPSAAVLEVKNVRVVEKRERAGESSLTKALDLVANEVEVKEEVVEEEEPEMEQEEEEVPDYWQTLATAPGSGSVKNKERQTTPLEDDEFDSPPLDMTPRRAYMISHSSLVVRSMLNKETQISHPAVNLFLSLCLQGCLLLARQTTVSVLMKTGFTDSNT
jgi:hypothetical protein